MRRLAALGVLIAASARGDSLLGRAPPPPMALLEQADAVVEIEVTRDSADAGWREGDRWARAWAEVVASVKGDLAAGSAITIRHVIAKRGSTFCCQGLPRWKKGERLRIALVRDGKGWRAFAWNAFRVGDLHVAVWRDPAAHLEGPMRHEALALLARRGQARRAHVEPLLASKDARDIGFAMGILPDVGDPTLVARALEVATGARRLDGEDDHVVRQVVGAAWHALIEMAPGDPHVAAALLWGERTPVYEEVAEMRGEELGRRLRLARSRKEITAALIARAESDRRPALLAALAPLDARATYRLLTREGAPRTSMPLAIALLRPYATTFAQRAALERGLPILDETLVLAHGRLPARGDPERAAQRLITEQQRKGPAWRRAPLASFPSWAVYGVASGARVELQAAARKVVVTLMTKAIAPATPGLDASAPARWLVDMDAEDGRFAQAWVAEDGTFGLSWIPDRAWGRSSELAALLAALVP